MSTARYVLDSTTVNASVLRHPWLGYFTLTDYSFFSDWIYHYPLGWLYSFYASDDYAYLYSMERGWLWTSQLYSPWVYSFTERQWINFENL